MHTQQTGNTTQPTSTSGVIPHIRQMSETIKGFSQGCSRNEAFAMYVTPDSHADIAEVLKSKAK